MKLSRILFALSLAVWGCSRAQPSGSRPPDPPLAVATPAVAAELASPSRVVTERWASEALGVEKSVLVYLPRGYDAQPARRYPVFYYLHGLGGDQTNWVESGKLDAVADQLGLQAIVVMPDGDDDFYINSTQPVDLDACRSSGAGLFLPGRSNPASNCVRARNYETYLARDLVQWVDARYRTLATREGRAIAGLSMGGFGAMAIALRHQDEFAAAASHSGAIALLYDGPHPFVPGQGQQASAVPTARLSAGMMGRWLLAVFGDQLETWRAYDAVALSEQLKPGALALYFDCGTEDDFGLHDNLQYLHQVLTARHLEHAYFLGPGRHDFTFWRERLPHSLAFLRDHTAKPQ